LDVLVEIAPYMGRPRGLLSPGGRGRRQEFGDSEKYLSAKGAIFACRRLLTFRSNDRSGGCEAGFVRLFFPTLSFYRLSLAQAGFDWTRTTVEK
jgi:hypothetical protein